MCPAPPPYRARPRTGWRVSLLAPPPRCHDHATRCATRTTRARSSAVWAGRPAGGFDWRTHKYACSCSSSPLSSPPQGIHTGGAGRGSPSPPHYLPCSTSPPSVGQSSVPAARLRRLPRVSAGAAGHLFAAPALELRGGGAKKVKGPAPDVKSVLAVGSVCAAVLCPPQAQRKQQVEGGQKAKSGTR